MQQMCFMGIGVDHCRFNRFSVCMCGGLQIWLYKPVMFVMLTAFNTMGTVRPRFRLESP